MAKGFYPVEPPPTTAPRWPVALAGAAVMLAMGFCLICGIGLYFFRPVIRENAQAARQATDRMLTIEIPELFEPAGTIEWNLLYAATLRGVYYNHRIVDGQLSLVEVDAVLTTQRDVREFVRQTLREAGGGGSPVVIKNREVRNLDIGGEAYPFSFESGSVEGSDRVIHLIEGVVPGKQSEILVAVRIDADGFDEQEIETMLQSIR